MNINKDTKDDMKGGRNSIIAKADKKIMTGQTAGVAAEENEAGDDNNSLADAIQEAIQLEDSEGEYSSSAQAQEEDALLKEFGF